MNAICVVRGFCSKEVTSLTTSLRKHHHLCVLTFTITCKIASRSLFLSLCGYVVEQSRKNSLIVHYQL